MKKLVALCLASIAAMPFAAPLQASEADFLQQLAGDWTGGGQVRLRPTSEPMNVSCSLQSEANGASLSMDGTCRAMAIFSRAIGAQLQTQGSSYSGTYVGSNRGPASLSGSRAGNRIELDLAWPNTGREADMQVETLGEGAMRLVTLEAHPETGERIVTAQLEFTRR